MARWTVELEKMIEVQDAADETMEIISVDAEGFVIIRPVDLEELAYHEAGHAMMAWYFNREVIVATIERETFSEGRVTVRKPNLKSPQLVAFEALFLNIAGWAAVAMQFPHTDTHFSEEGTDVHEFCRAAFFVWPQHNDEQLAFEMNRVQRRAFQIMGAAWPVVSDLAAALRSCRSLSGEEVHAIIDASGVTRDALRRGSA